MWFEHIIVAIVAAIPATLAALGAWRKSHDAEVNTRAIGNGWTGEVISILNAQSAALGRVEEKLDEHIADPYAHRRGDGFY